MVSSLLAVTALEPLTLVSPLQTQYYATQLFNGLMLGMTLVLVSLGLTLIFGLLGVINFAHGDILLVGTYLAWTIQAQTGSFLLAIGAAILGTFVLGVVLERTLLRYTYGRYNALLQLLLTFGIAEFLRGGVMLVWGQSGKNFPNPSWAQGSIDLVLFSYPLYRTLVIVAGAVLIAALYLFLNRTDMGLLIRAGTQDREMVDALGIDVSRIYLVVFGIGAALAGTAGALIGPVRAAYPTLGIELLIPAFVVVVVGGLGSFRGTIIAGLLIGELQVLTGMVYAQASEVIVFVFMAVILLVRPRGLFGEEGVIE
ncbi:branched-chain amino acid ABC transporter permease [Halomarina ordinaria]|uniref:Branched-chain amino acid ABC transporter permease n=1 Tax=Halomarina ordinaria TaxID=3033939 RepID=A0ABD5UJ76_9EURY|nr:branched-chain amino acid ABC transporter permease [Halomarina sp. PSRA2]